MLKNASEIKGYAIAASDGNLGSVSDLLFDDATWLVRWVVVDTGHWLSGRKVLLPASVLGHLDQLGHCFAVRLTMRQVGESPEIDTDKPVSRQMETGIYDYYGWSPYWGTGFYMGGYGYMPPIAESTSPGGWDRGDAQANDGDRHLRSVAEVTGYHIHARDGDIGHVADFLVEYADWSIHYLVIDTSNWWLGRKVLISPGSAKEIDWGLRLINLDVDRQRVRDSPAYDASTRVDRPYETHFHRHYAGRDHDGVRASGPL